MASFPILCHAAGRSGTATDHIQRAPNGRDSSRVPKDSGGQVAWPVTQNYWLIAAVSVRCLKNHEGDPIGSSALAILTWAWGGVSSISQGGAFVMAV
jgi:hypothetical protein